MHLTELYSPERSMTYDYANMHDLSVREFSTYLGRRREATDGSTGQAAVVYNARASTNVYGVKSALLL